MHCKQLLSVFARRSAPVKAAGRWAASELLLTGRRGEGNRASIRAAAAIACSNGAKGKRLETRRGLRAAVQAGVQLPRQWRRPSGDQARRRGRPPPSLIGSLVPC